MKILINTDVTPEQQQQIEAVSDDLSLVKPQNSEAALREICGYRYRVRWV